MNKYCRIVSLLLILFVQNITGLCQNSFELKIDVPGIFEYPVDVKQISNGNYVSIVLRDLPSYEWKKLSIFFLINENGQIIAHDSLIHGDTIFNVRKIIPYSNGILAFGHFGFFNDTSVLKPMGQFIAYYDLNNNQFNLNRLNRYYIKNSQGETFSWSTWPLIKPGTDTCFIGCLKEGFNVKENLIFIFNAETGDSLSVRSLSVPLSFKSCDLVFTSDNKLNVLFEHWTNNDYTVSLFKLNEQYSAFSDTLVAHPILLSDDTKVEALPNGNIVIAGQCDSVTYQPFDVLFAFGVFLYDSNFNYIDHHVLTHFYEDTASQAAWSETIKVNSQGEIFILSNYYFQAFPFDGKATIGYIAKLDPDLNLLWEDYFGGDKFHSLMVIEPTDDGGVIFCSHSNELIDTTSKTYSWFRKYDLNGYVGIDDKIPEELKMNLYPNPASDHIVIRSVKLGEKVEIIDLNGKLIHSIHTNSFPATINISALERGIYLVRITFKDGIIENHKFLKI